MSVTYRVFTEHLGNQDVTTFIANEGDLFYDPAVPILYIGDGSTPGGLPLAGGGGGGNISFIQAGTGINVQNLGANTGIIRISILPASGGTIGGIKAGANTSVDANGVLTVDFSSLYAAIAAEDTALRANDYITLTAAKAYSNTVATDLRANDYLTLTVSKAYTDATNTWIQNNISGGGANGVSNAQLAQANTWLQANDFATLTTAKGYTDTANTFLQAQVAAAANAANLQLAYNYTNTAVDLANTWLQANDAATLATARGIALNVLQQAYANDYVTLTVAKAYTDATNNWIQNEFANNGVLVTSNVLSLAVGAALKIQSDYTNPLYKGGIFTIYQDGGSFAAMNSIWENSASFAKNAYLDFANSVINTSNVDTSIITYIGVWDIQTTDDITIDGNSITGANLLSLGISGTGGTYAISSDFLTSNNQTDGYVTVTANLSANIGTTTERYFINSSDLNNIPPVPYEIIISATWQSPNVPYFSTTQSFNWTVNEIGSGISGTLSLGGSHTETLTSTGQTSGTSSPWDSTTGTFDLSGTYYGAGFFGAGQNNSSNTNSLSVVPSYIPLFYKQTSSNLNPIFTTSDTYLSHEFVLGDGAFSSAVTTEYLWLAIPVAIYPTEPVFRFVFGGFEAVTTPDQTYTAVDIAGESYNVYGFTNFNQAVLIFTASI